MDKIIKPFLAGCRETAFKLRSPCVPSMQNMQVFSWKCADCCSIWRRSPSSPASRRRRSQVGMWSHDMDWHPSKQPTGNAKGPMRLYDLWISPSSLSVCGACLRMSLARLHLLSLRMLWSGVFAREPHISQSLWHVQIFQTDFKFITIYDYIWLYITIIYYFLYYDYILWLYTMII